MPGKFGVRELAKLAAVSVGTVDRALHGRPDVSEKTRRKVVEIARRHGYSPDPTARALSVRRSAVRIGVCVPREIRYFYDQLWEGVREEAARFRHLGIELVERPVRTLDSPQVRTLRGLVENSTRAIILTPGRPAELTPLIDEAERRSIRVVCVASDDSLSRRSSAISVEPHLNGALAGELLARFVPPGAEVAVVTGMMGTEDHAKKVAGFSRSFPALCREGRIVQVIEGHEKESETYRKCAAMLRRHSELAGLYVSTVNCLPVCRAIEDAGRAREIRLIATDLFPEAVPYFENGLIAAAIHQRPRRQGQLAVKLLVDHFLEGRPFPSVRRLNPAIVMRANLRLFPESGMDGSAAPT